MAYNAEKGSERIKAVVALIIGIFIALLASETILQIINYPKRPLSGWLNCPSKIPEECNSLGFRGRDIVYSDDDFIVVLMGDSEVYAASFPFEQIPELRLEHFLKKYIKNVKVFTIADTGYGQDQQLLALKEYFENYRADLVLLMFTARNDIDNNLYPTSGANDTIKPTFWLEGGKLMGPTEGWLEPVGSRIKLSILLNHYIGEKIGESRVEMWKKDILPPPYQPMTHYEGEVDYYWQELWDKNPEAAYKGIEYERVGDSNKWTPRSEMREYGIHLTQKLFSEIKKLVELNDGNFVVFKEERPWELSLSGSEKAYFLNSNYYVTSIKQYQANMRDLFDGFDHYRIPLGIDKYKVKPGNFHLNQKAVDIVFEELSEVLNKQRYLKHK